MKQDKRKKRNDNAQNASPYTPASSYGGFMGDPRLSKMANDAATEKKAKSSGRVSRVISTVGTVLVIAFVLTLPLALLYEHLSSKDSPKPDNTLITGPAPETPVQPQIPPTSKPDPEPTPDPELSWNVGLLSFDPQGFITEFETQYGSFAMEYQLYIITGTYEHRGNQSTDFIRNCTYAMRSHFYCNEDTVSFSSSKISSVLEVFLLEGFEAVRRQKEVDEYLTKQECLDVVLAAADRICAIAYVNENKVNITDDQFDQITGGYSVGQWGNYANARLEAYDVYWTDWKKRTEVNNMYGHYADSLAQGLMLYLYGYTPSRSTADGGGTKFLNVVNAGLDRSAMISKQTELTSYIRDRLPRFAERSQETENGMRYSVGVIPYKFYQSLIDMMPGIVEDVVGMDYAEFISSGAFVNAPYDGGVLRARYCRHAEQMVWGIPRLIHRSDLDALLSSVTFVPGDIALTKQAEIGYYQELFPFEMMGIRYYSLPIVSAGFDEQGNYYLQSSNYYAKITQAQYELFIGICTDGEEDNNKYAYERYELNQSLKK